MSNTSPKKQIAKRNSSPPTRTNSERSRIWKTSFADSERKQQKRARLRRASSSWKKWTASKPRRVPPIPFTSASPAKRSGQRVATLEGVDQAYGDHQVYEGLNLNIEKEQRIVLVGPNGAGKSTLLKIAEQVEIQSGSRELGLNVSTGYFSQQRVEVLDLERTVLDEAMERVETGMNETSVRGILGAFLFRGDDVFKKVKVLSGGEKSRLALVKLLLAPPNFLLLDEPRPTSICPVSTL